MKKVERLQEVAKNTHWMADVKDCLENDLDNIELSGDIESDVQELVNIFEDRWQETDYFRIRVMSKAKEIASEKIDYKESNEKLVEMYEYSFYLIDENFWQIFHNENDTYEKAETLIKEKLEEEKYAKRD